MMCIGLIAALIAASATAQPSVNVPAVITPKSGPVWGWRHINRARRNTACSPA